MIRSIVKTMLAVLAAVGLFTGCETTSSNSGGGAPSAVEGVWVRASGTSTETVSLLSGGIASLDSMVFAGTSIQGKRYEGSWTGAGDSGSVSWTSVSTTTDGITWTPKQSINAGPYPFEVNGSTGTVTVNGVKREYTKGEAATQAPVADVVAPTISVPTGTYPTTQTVSIVTATVGGTIRYTTDGTTPTSSSSLYSSAISVASTKTIKAITVLGIQTSSVSSVTITIDGGSKPDTKVASLVGSWVAYDATTQTYLTLDFSTDGEVARSIQSTKGFEVHQGTFSTSAGTLTMTWTDALKGTDPGALSPIAVPAPTVATYSVSAGKLSLASGGKATIYSSDSPVIEDPVVVPLEAPVISPAGGTFSSAKSVTISAEPGATIYFTVNGSTPTLSSNRYSGAISIASTQTIKAIAVLDGEQSPVASAKITINPSTVIDSDLVGTWRAEDADYPGGIIFDAYGNVALRMKYEMEEGGVMYSKVEGTYTVSGSSLTMVFTDSYTSDDDQDWGVPEPTGGSLNPSSTTFSISGNTLRITSISAEGTGATQTFTKASSVY